MSIPQYRRVRTLNKQPDSPDTSEEHCIGVMSRYSKSCSVITTLLVSLINFSIDSFLLLVYHGIEKQAICVLQWKFNFLVCSKKLLVFTNFLTQFHGPSTTTASSHTIEVSTNEPLRRVDFPWLMFLIVPKYESEAGRECCKRSSSRYWSASLFTPTKLNFTAMYKSIVLK